MSLPKKRIILAIMMLFIVITGIYILSNHSENSDFPKTYEEVEATSINVNFSNLNFEKPSTYDALIKSINLFQPITYAHLIDSINAHCDSNQRNHQILLSVALTSSNQSIDTSLSLDSLFLLYKLAFECKTLSKALPDKSTFYKVVSDYWYRSVCQQMSQKANNNSGIVYDQKFNVLYQLLQTELYTPNLKKSNSDKVIYNLQQSKFGYLIYKFKIIFGIPGLILTLLIISFTLYLYIQFILKLIRKKQTP
jgi:hypothetical protein